MMTLLIDISSIAHGFDPDRLRNAIADGIRKIDPDAGIGRILFRPGTDKDYAAETSVLAASWNEKIYGRLQYHIKICASEPSSAVLDCERTRQLMLAAMAASDRFDIGQEFAVCVINDDGIAFKTLLGKDEARDAWCRPENWCTAQFEITKKGRK